MLAANKNKQIITITQGVQIYAPNKASCFLLLSYLSDHNNHRNRTRVLLFCSYLHPSSSSPTLSRTWCGGCEAVDEASLPVAHLRQKQQNKTTKQKQDTYREGAGT